MGKRSGVGAVAGEKRVELGRGGDASEGEKVEEHGDEYVVMIEVKRSRS